MAYAEEMEKLRRNGDGAMLKAFLEDIFRAPENQKVVGEATEYLFEALHEGDKAQAVTAAEIFDAIVTGFSPRAISQKLETLFEDWGFCSEAEQARWASLQRFKPFNGIRFSIGDYERCDATMFTGSYSPQTGEFSEAYGLSAEIVCAEESEENYDLVYDLRQAAKYRLFWEGERLNNPRLYHDLKATLFTPYLLEVVEHLFNDERFARFPKAFPFHIQFSSGSEENHFFFEGPSISEGDLSRFDTAQLHLESQVEVVELSPLERFEFYKRFVTRPDGASYKELLALCLGQRDCFDRLLTMGREALEAGHHEQAAHYCRALWDLYEVAPEAVWAFQQELLHRSAPDVNAITDAPDGYSRLANLFSAARQYLAMLEACRNHAPAAHRGAVEARFEEAVSQLLTHDNALFRTLGREAICPEDQTIELSAYSRGPAVPDAAYIADVVALIDLLPRAFRGYSDSWNYIAERLTHLGEQASSAVPGLLNLLDQYLDGYFNAQVANILGKLLFAVGCEEIPAAIHQAQTPYYQEEYYTRWLEQGVRRAWQTMEKAWADAPSSFEAPQAWEEYLPETQKGLKYFANALWELDEVARVLPAAGTEPGPKLVEFLYALSDLQERDDATTVGLLSKIADISAPYARKLEKAEVALLVENFPNDPDTALELIEGILERYPDNQTVRLIVAERLVQNTGENHLDALMDAFERYADDADRAAPLARLLWHVAPDALLQKRAFQRYIPHFIEGHGSNRQELTRRLLVGLEELGHQRVIVDLAGRLEPSLVITCFKTFLPAFFALEAYDEAHALCERLAEDLDERHPDWLLIESNRAVTLIRSGRHEEAMALFDDIFSRDYSRFEERDDEDEDDLLMELLGDKVSKQIITAFQTYFALARYNHACLLALMGRSAEALVVLQEALSRGHYKAEQLLAEPDFAELHHHASFQRLVEDLPTS